MSEQPPALSRSATPDISRYSFHGRHSYSTGSISGFDSAYEIPQQASDSMASSLVSQRATYASTSGAGAAFNSPVALSNANPTYLLDPVQSGYILLHIYAMEDLANKLPNSLSQDVRIPLLQNLAFLKGTQLSIQQKILLVQHMYRAFSFFQWNNNSFWSQ
jgi:hypothetical protein